MALQCNDGGANVTIDGGKSWSSILNQATGEYYMVSVDEQFPYRLYAPQQDNTTLVTYSLPPTANRFDHPSQLFFQASGCETGGIWPRPDGKVIWGACKGEVGRYNVETGQEQHYWVYPQNRYGHNPKDIKYRFPRQTVVFLSPHDPKTIYQASHVLHRSTDEGKTWETISPDLTAFEPDKQVLPGTPITRDITGEEVYSNIYAAVESRLEKGVLWTGANDGPVHVSRDGGKTWTNVTPKDLPPGGRVQNIEDSPHRKGSVYVAVYRYLREHDLRPYIYRTDDYGVTWTRLTTGHNGVPADYPTRVVREDPAQEGLLFAGTETGVYVSYDDGGRWQRLQANLPHVPVHDLVVKDADLVLGTHGRSFWVLDDMTAVRAWSAPKRSEAARLFPPRPTYRIRSKGGFPGKPVLGKNYRFTDATMLTYRLSEKKDAPGEREETYLDAGKNPPDEINVIIEIPKDAEPVKYEGRGRLIRSFTSRKTGATEPPPPSAALPVEGAETVAGPGAAPTATKPEEEETKEPRVPKEPGLDRFVWNMRHPDASKVADDPSMEEFERALAGPVVPPGRYQVRLKVGDTTLTEPFEVRKDPRVGVPEEAIREQFELLLAIRDKLSETHDAISTIRSLRRQVEEWEVRTGKERALRPVTRSASSLRKALTAVEEELVQTKARSRQDTLNFPIKLNAKLGGLGAAVAQADARPTASQRAVFADLSRRIDAQLAKLRNLTSKDVPQLARTIRSAGVPPIVMATAAQKRPARLRKAAAAK